MAADCGAAYRYAFCYTIEAFINGDWQITDYFTEADDNAEALYDEKINGENSYWNILDDFGKMREISLYSRD